MHAVFGQQIFSSAHFDSPISLHSISPLFTNENNTKKIRIFVCQIGNANLKQIYINSKIKGVTKHKFSENLFRQKSF